MKKILETERLILRELHIDDAPFIVELLNTPSFLRFIGDRGVRNTLDAVQYLQNGPLKSYKDNGFGLWMIVLKDYGTLAGLCGLIDRPGLDGIDIGFSLMPAFEKKGIGYEAAAAVMRYGMQELKIPRIIAITDPENRSSIQLLRKLGMEQDGTVRLPGEEVDLLLFEIH